MNETLRARLSSEDWDSYKRLTSSFNTPPTPWMRRALIATGALTLVCAVGMGIAMGTSTNGGASAIPWMQGAIGIMFLGLLCAAVVESVESRKVRAKTLAALVHLEATAEKHPVVAASDNGYPAPYYPVTDGVYDPHLYLSRGGKAAARLIADQGYPDWETYEANKPD